MINGHKIIYSSEDVYNNGPFDDFSADVFENYFLILKNIVIP